VISSRFVPAVCVLVAVALIPTYIHSYAGSTVQDGRTTASIPVSLAQYQGTTSDRNATWGKRRFDSDDWTERIYRSSAGDEVKLSVVRSFDPKSLYHHPELAVSYGPSWVKTEVRRLSRRPDIPVHVLYTGAGRTVALYALYYGDSFVKDPIRFQLRTAGELLFSGRKAMTLFFLTDESVPAGINVDGLPSIGLFFDAIEHFIASGGPSR
jgi:hypothetical protein